MKSYLTSLYTGAIEYNRIRKKGGSIKMKIIDLSQLIKEGMPVYPGTEGPKLTQATTVLKDGFAEKLLNMYSHTGTHIDAPCHIYNGEKSLDQFSVEKFVGKAMVIDVENEVEISLDILKEKELEIEKVDFILFRSGWDRYWGKEEYFGEFPSLTKEAALWLITKGLKGIGIDAISLDKMADEHLPIHKILLKEDYVFIENLKNLDKLKGKEFIFSCLPLKIEDADGSPVRAIAIVE